MLSRLLAPAHGIDLDSLRRAGRFASPEGDGGEGGGKEGEGAGEAGKDGGKPKPEDTGGRIAALVEERNAARQEAEKHKAAIDKLRGELDQLKANDQSKVVADLQKKLDEIQSSTATRFDKLLETELANLPDAAQKAVKAIPGGSEAQFDWLVANRAILQPATKEEPAKPAGAANEKKPNGSSAAGVSSIAKAAVEARKAAAKAPGFPGLTG